MDKRILLSPPHMSEHELKYVDAAFHSNWIAPLGPMVDAFEDEITKFIGGIEGAVAMSSGTAAIHIALKLLGIEPGDRVLCSSLTFVASANPILYEKAIPVFLDSEPDTWCLDPNALARAIQATNPIALVAVDLIGNAPDYEMITDICRQYGVAVIEDAAESLGSIHKGTKCGSFGDFGILSFNGNKIITTSGGGMLLCHKQEHIEKAKFLITQAREDELWYEHKEVGYNYRMSNICAAIGRGQLEVLKERVKRRREIFLCYQKELGEIEGLLLMPEGPETKSNRWLTVAYLDPYYIKKTPTEIITKLNAEAIEARHLWKPLHLQPLFKNCEYYPHQDGDFSKQLFERSICLPSGTAMTNDDVKEICNEIKKILN